MKVTLLLLLACATRCQARIPLLKDIADLFYSHTSSNIFLLDEPEGSILDFSDDRPDRQNDTKKHDLDLIGQAFDHTRKYFQIVVFLFAAGAAKLLYALLPLRNIPESW